MGRCYYISILLATKFFPLMAQDVCHFPFVFAPNLVQLCVVSTEAPGPKTVKRYTQWWRILEWIASWWLKNEVINEGLIIERVCCSSRAFDEQNICNATTFVDNWSDNYCWLILPNRTTLRESLHATGHEEVARRRGPCHRRRFCLSFPTTQYHPIKRCLETGKLYSWVAPSRN